MIALESIREFYNSLECSREFIILQTKLNLLMLVGLGDMGMSVLSVCCGEGGLTSAWMGEGGLVVVCFFGFNRMLLAPVCIGW